MNIALVLPPAEKIAEKKDTPKYQHVGLGYLSAMLERDGFNVKVIDAKLQRIDFEQTVGAIKDFNPELLGITAMTHEINNAARLAQEIKKALPGVFIVIGGVHVTALPIDTLKAYPSFDAGVMGEGEYTLSDIAKMAEKKDIDLSKLKGVVYRKDSKILLSQPAERIEDIDSLPLPAWHQFPKASEYILLTSRGCPFSCVFCMQALGNKVRKRSAHNVVEEIENVLSQRVPSRFLFYDETFTVDKARVTEICNLIIRKGLNKSIRWAVTTRVDCVDRDLLYKMKEAGCNHIEFGIESGDQWVLDSIKKKITLKQAEYAVGLAKELGFHTEGAFILGHPNETLKTACKTISFAAKLNPDIIQLGIMVPYPGTEVAKMAREGRGGYKIISDNWSDYNKQLGNALELEGLSRSDLERLQLAGYLKLFIFNRRFIDLSKFIWDYRMEMFSFLKNHFKKERGAEESNLNFSSMARLIFKKT